MHSRKSLLALPLLLSLLAASSAYTLGYAGNEDFWWYLASGDEILERGAIPERDPFLYTSAARDTWVTSAHEQRTWVTHSWLWTVLLAWLHRGLGLEGIALFSTLCVAALVVLTFRRARLDPLGLVPGALTALALAASAARFTPRTDLVTCLLLVAYLALLERGRPLGWPRVALLCALQWLWSNLHGAYPLGIGIAAGYAAAGWLRGVRSAPLLALAPLLLLASLATPGLGAERIGGALAFARELGSSASGAAQNPLWEWQPTYAGLGASAALHALLCLLGAASFAAARRPVSLGRACVFAGAALLGASAERFVGVFAWAAAFLTLANLAELRPALRTRLAALQRPWLRAPYRLLTAAACALLVWTAGALWLARDALDGSLRREGFVAARPEFMAPGAAAYLREHAVPGPIFNEISLGGYLVHALYPEQQLFIDTRNLSAAVLDDYRNAMALPEAWRAQQGRHGFRTVVLSNLSFTPMRLRRLLAADAFWRLVYADPQAAVFVRGDTSALPLVIEPSGRWKDRAPFLPPQGPGPQRLLHRFGLSLLLEYLRALAELDLPDALEQVAGLGLAAEPEEPELLAFRGYARLRQANPLGAAEDFTRVVEQRPANVTARLNLARALSRTGRTDEALAQLDRVRELEPEHPGQARLRAQLERRARAGR